MMRDHYIIIGGLTLVALVVGWTLGGFVCQYISRRQYARRGARRLDESIRASEEAQRRHDEVNERFARELKAQLDAKGIGR